jgi:SWI2/SNF2 ATPase-like protein
LTSQATCAMRDALSHASFIGFIGTPIEPEAANTRAVFSDHITVHDTQSVVGDGWVILCARRAPLSRMRPHGSLAWVRAADRRAAATPSARSRHAYGCADRKRCDGAFWCVPRTLIPPERFEPVGRQLRIPHRTP